MGEHFSVAERQVPTIDRAPSRLARKPRWLVGWRAMSTDPLACRWVPLARSVTQGGSMIFVGIDWAERHHDVCVIDADGQLLAKGRIVEGLDGVARLHALIGKHAADPDEVVVGVETDRGLLVEALVGSGYRVYAVNPFAASRYRDRGPVCRGPPTSHWSSSMPISRPPPGPHSRAARRTFNIGGRSSLALIGRRFPRRIGIPAYDCLRGPLARVCQTAGTRGPCLRGAAPPRALTALRADSR